MKEDEQTSYYDNTDYMCQLSLRGLTDVKFTMTTQLDYKCQLTTGASTRQMTTSKEIIWPSCHWELADVKLL